MKLNESYKTKVREALINASNTVEANGKPSGFDIRPFFESELRRMFPGDVHTKFTRHEFDLDILIDECCVIKIKNKPDDRFIQKIVKDFDLPAVYVNLHNWMNPFVDWHYYDEELKKVLRENNAPENVKKIYLKRKMQGFEEPEKQNNPKMEEISYMARREPKKTSSCMSFGDSVLIVGGFALFVTILVGALFGVKLR